MTHNIKNTIKKYINILYTKIVLASKLNKEYKIQLWSRLTFELTLIFVYLIFYKVYSTFNNKFLNWQYIDYITFFSIIMLIAEIKSAFSIRNMFQSIISGELNNYLTKPVNLHFILSIKKINGGLIVSLPLFFSLNIIWILNHNYSNFLLYTLLLLLFSLYFIIFINLIETTAFYFKGSNNLRIITGNINYINEKFTPKVFENSILKNIFYLLPSAFYSYFLVQILKKNYENFFYYFYISLIIFVTSIIILKTIWIQGLKKYEAYS